jgi:hypothetical protein
MLYQLSYSRSNPMERGGFEPPKAEPADLQSAPFGHSGTSPNPISTGPPLINITIPNPKSAGEGIRTRDLLITNQLLYQLSYASNKACNNPKNHSPCKNRAFFLRTGSVKRFRIRGFKLLVKEFF